VVKYKKHYIAYVLNSCKSSLEFVLDASIYELPQIVLVLHARLQVYQETAAYKKYINYKLLDKPDVNCQEMVTDLSSLQLFAQYTIFVCVRIQSDLN